MPEKDKENLADALAALAAGEHHEAEVDEHGHDEHPAEPAPPPRPVTPAGGMRAPAAPIPKPRPAAPTPPTAQARPAAPGRPAAPQEFEARPGAPSYTPPPVEEEFIVQDPGADEMVPDAATGEQGGDWVGTAPLDDDAMLAPAPDPSQLAAPHHAPVRRKAGPQTKQTMIPIMLTTGLLLMVFSSLKFVLGPDSPYHDLSGLLVGIIAGAGAVLLGAAFFTMLQVQNELERRAKR